MFKEFRTFIARGNVVDLAIAVVIGAAFGAVITSFVKDLLTPLITIPGTINFDSLHVKVGGGDFLYGAFIDAALTFVIIAAAIFFLVVKPLNALQARRSRGQAQPDPTTRQCPACLSEIPLAASKCAFCTIDVVPVTPDGSAASPSVPTTT